MASLAEWKRVGLFVPYHGNGWSRGSDQDAYEAVMDWCHNLTEHLRTGKGLLIMGKPGRGKTLLAHLAADAVLEARGQFPSVSRRNLLYGATVQGFLDLLRRQMDYLDVARKTGDAAAAANYSRIDTTLAALRTSIRVLLLDDIGKEHITNTGFAQNQVERLIRSRGNQGLVNIVTTNLGLKDLGEFYGESFASYLLQVCVPVPVLGEDHRKKGLDNGSSR